MGEHLLRLLLYEIRNPIIDAFLKLGSEFPPIEGTKRYPAIDLELKVTYGRVRLIDEFIYGYGIDLLPPSQLVDLVAVSGVDAVIGVLPQDQFMSDTVPYIELEQTMEATPALLISNAKQWRLQLKQDDAAAVMNSYQLIRDQLLVAKGS